FCAAARSAGLGLSSWLSFAWALESCACVASTFAWAPATSLLPPPTWSVCSAACARCSVAFALCTCACAFRMSCELTPVMLVFTPLVVAFVPPLLDELLLRAALDELLDEPLVVPCWFTSWSRRDCAIC